MKKLINSTLIVFLTSFVFSQNSESINDGKVLGSFDYGSKEVTSILDESTDCVRKSNPHTKGLFTPNERVQIVIKENKQMVEVLKPSLQEQVFANKQCDEAGELDIFELANGNDNVTVSCAGSCDCSLMGVLNGDNPYVSCSCNECTMQVTFTRSVHNGNTPNDNANENAFKTKVYNLVDANIEVPFIDDYLDYAPSERLKTIEFHKRGENYMATYTYVDQEGNEDTVTFAKANGNTYKIQCTGDCGCKEVYSFNTNSASCSCDNCTMTVEQIR